MSALKPYLQLVRLPNVFTAAGDSLAGWLLVMGSLSQAERWGPLVLASMAIYAAGIVLNDLFDIELDRAERPKRPLPSGRVSKRFAIALASILLGLGMLFAALSGSWVSLAVAGVLIACVVGYDAGLRKTWLGPQVMGACRGLNVLLGMSQAPEFGGPWAWLVAGSLAVFVVGITWISRLETQEGGRVGPATGLICQNLGILGLMGAALQHGQFPGVPTDRAIIPLEGLLVLGLVALVVNLATGRALKEPTPSTLQRAVKTGVLSLIWLNVGIVVAVRGLGYGLVVAALWLPAYFLGRWLYVT